MRSQPQALPQEALDVGEANVVAPIRLGNDRDVLSQPTVLRLGDEVHESVDLGALFRPDPSLDCLVLGNVRGRASG